VRRHGRCSDRPVARFRAVLFGTAPRRDHGAETTCGVRTRRSGASVVWTVEGLTSRVWGARLQWRSLCSPLLACAPLCRPARLLARAALRRGVPGAAARTLPRNYLEIQVERTFHSVVPLPFQSMGALRQTKVRILCSEFVLAWITTEVVLKQSIKFRACLRAVRLDSSVRRCTGWRRARSPTSSRLRRLLTTSRSSRSASTRCCQPPG